MRCLYISNNTKKYGTCQQDPQQNQLENTVSRRILLDIFLCPVNPPGDQHGKNQEDEGIVPEGLPHIQLQQVQHHPGHAAARALEAISAQVRMT